MNDDDPPAFEDAIATMSQLGNDLDALGPVVDHSLLPQPGGVSGVVDVDAREAPNVDAYADELEAELDLQVTECGIPAKPHKLGVPLAGLASKTTYTHEVYRYEIVAPAGGEWQDATESHR